jgi:hypothetical protein
MQTRPSESVLPLLIYTLRLSTPQNLRVVTQRRGDDPMVDSGRSLGKEGGGWPIHVPACHRSFTHSYALPNTIVFSSISIQQ